MNDPMPIGRIEFGPEVSGAAPQVPPGVAIEVTPARPVKHYAHYLGVTQFIELRFACAIVKGTFTDSFGMYLVGSAMTRKDWRDVDVRHIISDEEFERRFGEFIEPYDRNKFLRAFNLGVSAWMSSAAKLPVDYQVQPITKANELYPHATNPRNGLGLL